MARIGTIAELETTLVYFQRSGIHDVRKVVNVDSTNRDYNTTTSDILLLG